MRQAELFELIDVLTKAGLTIPKEVNTLPHLIIAVRANATLNRGDDRDQDEEDSPSMLMSSLRYPRRHSTRSFLPRSSRIAQVTKFLTQGLPEPKKKAK